MKLFYISFSNKQVSAYSAYSAFDETNSTNSDTGTLPNCSATENCSRADNAARRTRAFIWNKINNITCLTLFYLLWELMSYHTFRVVYDKRENQHRSRSYQIPQIKIEGMFLYFFQRIEKESAFGVSQMKHHHHPLPTVSTFHCPAH